MENKEKTCLFAILDWGLGHATRSVPIISAYYKNDYRIIICSAGNALTYLKKTFPEATFYELPPLQVKYSLRYSFAFVLIRLLPRFTKRFIAERHLANQLVQQYQPDIIISDHCYGFFDRNLSSVIIIHQINPVFKGFLRFFRKPAFFFHKKLLSQFSHVWVPDEPPPEDLTGELSCSVSGLSLKRVGWLSALQKRGATGKHYFDLLVLLSGPEPFRTQWEEVILEQLEQINLKAMLIRGLPDEGGDIGKEVPENVCVSNFAGGEELSELMADSELILARSGYSTVMDVASMGKKALFVPTPGQPEQETLAKHISGKGLCYCTNQHEMFLERDFFYALKFPGFKGYPDGKNERLEGSLKVI